MRNAAAMLYCPNPTCQASNSEGRKFCQKCATLLPKRYLWALGDGVSAYQPGSMLAERYLCKQSRIFLDTKPGLLSSTYQELSEVYSPYLRLVSYPLHVPQVYDWIPASPLGQEIVLLDHAALGRFGRSDSAQPTQPIGPASDSLETDLLPSIASQWQHGSSLRQLNWLWQMANLWQPLSSERATASLLDAENLRIDSTLVRLLELRFDSKSHSLADLGQFWLMWAELAQPPLQEFMAQLCQALLDGQIYNAELLVGYLDQAFAQIGAQGTRIGTQNSPQASRPDRSGQARQIYLATLSDQGPTRQRNEDACYPASGTHQSAADRALLIVCDGIGGHQGGDVASHLAISKLEQQVNALAAEQLDPIELTIALEKAVCAANDEISQQNDSEQRFERQRMGTTVVMALALNHELYITHVGDSRVYWMTRWGCYQLTLDDDVASREVRLGYSFYRQALHQPSAGSLVQALGMSASSMLYPSVQRLIPEEPGVFLLCSDGLSDNERVEEAWETDIRPLLEQLTDLNALDLANLSHRLVEIANTRNGYDNVTVGLLYYRPAQPDAQSDTIAALADLPPFTTTSPTLLTRPDPDSQTTQVVAPLAAEKLAPDTPGRKLLPLMGAGIGAVGLVGLLAALLPALRPAVQLSSPLVGSPSPNSNPAVGLTALEVGALIQLAPSAQPRLVARPPSPSPTPPAAIGLAPSPTDPVVPASPTAPPAPSPAASPEILGAVPAGAILEVLRKQNLSQQESWVELRVCSAPSPIEPPPESPLSGLGTGATPDLQPDLQPALQAGQTGWIREQEILPQAVLRPNLPTDQQQACQ